MAHRPRKWGPEEMGIHHTHNTPVLHSYELHASKVEHSGRRNKVGDSFLLHQCKLSGTYNSLQGFSGVADIDLEKGRTCPHPLPCPDMIRAMNNIMTQKVLSDWVKVGGKGHFYSSHISMWLVWCLTSEGMGRNNTLFHQWRGCLRLRTTSNKQPFIEKSRTNQPLEAAASVFHPPPFKHSMFTLAATSTGSLKEGLHLDIS